MLKSNSARTIILSLLVIIPSQPLVYATHWTPPSATNFWETVWGYLTGFTSLQAGDEIAAFNLSNDEIVGLATISFDGSLFGYNMVIFSPDSLPFNVYFLVWDGYSELSATPNFTTHPAEFGSGPTQHDIDNDDAVPEPPTIMMLCLSIILLLFFAWRPHCTHGS